MIHVAAIIGAAIWFIRRGLLCGGRLKRHLNNESVTRNTDRTTMAAPTSATARKPSSQPTCGVVRLDAGADERIGSSGIGWMGWMVPGNGRLDRSSLMRSRRRKTIPIIAAVTKNVTRPAMPPISQGP